VPEEKPFEPTESRLARAKREGDVPSSAPLCVAASLAGGALALFAVLDPLAGAARLAFIAAAGGRIASPWPFVALAAGALAVPCGALVAALLFTFLQNGRLTFRFPAPKLGRLDPGAGFKRMFSRDAAVGGAKALVVSAAVASVMLPALWGTFAAAGGVGNPAELGALAIRAFAEILWAALGVAAAFGAIDLLLERAKWKRRLRMTFDELRREHKQSEGDPAMRGRRRRAHRALVRGSIERLKEAAFVVCNPTHVAIALAYAPPDIPVPQVLVRAIDEGAREVKRRARALGVPIVENAVLARALLAATDAGDYIPAGTYGTVAAIVADLAKAEAIA
jgi:flagellar biosynthesis protein FlhB